MKTICKAPAKLILSGEHAVVNHTPAISMAIDLPTFCEMQFTSLPAGQIPFIEIDLVDCDQKHALPFSVWQKMGINIESRFHLYELGVSTIRSVLKLPVDLVITTLHHYHQNFGLKPGHWQIKIYGHEMLGKGLGSSASVIVSLLHSLFIHHNQKLNTLELLTLAKTIEARQHGKSSGIDPATIFHGGLLHYQTDHPFHPLETHSFSAWLIDTGMPESTTGQVVNFVQSRFPKNHAIWKRFAQTTETIESAWQQQDADLLRAGIRENEQLLEELQVVPEKVRHFIKELQKTPYQAAKICGAGSHTGNQGGVLLCVSRTAPLELCHSYGYNCIAINVSEKGSQCEMVE